MIVVLSEDPQVQRLSREVLSDLKREDLMQMPGTQAGVPSDADVCILDWPCGELPPGKAEPNPKGLRVYVVERNQIDTLPALLPPSTVGFLIKPVNRVALHVSLEQAIELAHSFTNGSRPLVAAADRDEILQSLLQAYLRLQEHGNDRAAFLARVLHDFRAPLTAINGYCGLLLEELLGPLHAKQRDAIYRMNRSATRLSRLAVSLFELTLHDRVRSEVRLSEHSIRDTVEQALHEIRPVFDERDIAVGVNLEGCEDRLCFDPGQIEQVLVNLLDNASRFTPRRGCIDIRGYPYFWDRRANNGVRTSEILDRRVAANTYPNSYRIDVRDNGPRIPADVLPMIFEEFYSTSMATDRVNGGLGLAICKSILRSHSGQIWASSGTEGTVFTFVLPLRRGGEPDSQLAGACAAERAPGDGD